MTLTAAWLAYDPSKVKPGWIAFLVVMALLVATFLLWRNMNKQLKRINVPYRAELEGDAHPKGGPNGATTVADNGERPSDGTDRDPDGA